MINIGAACGIPRPVRLEAFLEAAWELPSKLQACVILNIQCLVGKSLRQYRFYISYKLEAPSFLRSLKLQKTLRISALVHYS